MTEPHLTSKQDIRFGVVGLGLMGERHCRVIKAVPDAVLVGVCDHTPEVAQRISAENQALMFADFDAMIESDSIDAVVLCLPSGMHAEFGIKAARVGKHVVVEKPIDSQSGEAQRLIDACQAAGVQCAVISQNRYSPGLASLKAAVSSGLMGQPVLARATVKWFRHDEYYTGSQWRGRIAGEHGGVLMNQAVHSIDTLQWLFGVPTNVAGFSHCSRSQVLETEDTAVAIFRWKSGMVATLEASTSAAPGFDEAYEVHSSTASIKVEKGLVVFWHHAEGLPLPEPRLSVCPAQLDGKLELFFRQYVNIVAAIKGQASLEVSPAGAVAVVRTIEQIYRSSGAT